LNYSVCAFEHATLRVVLHHSKKSWLGSPKMKNLT